MDRLELVLREFFVNLLAKLMLIEGSKNNPFVRFFPKQVYL